MKNNSAVAYTVIALEHACWATNGRSCDNVDSKTTREVRPDCSNCKIGSRQDFRFSESQKKTGVDPLESSRKASSKERMNSTSTPFSERFAWTVSASDVA